MKARQSHMRVSPQGGIVPIWAKLKDYKIPELISSCLGPRVNQAKYSYEDAIISWILTVYTHGYRLLKIKDAENDLSLIPELSFPSHDTIGRLMKKLATESVNSHEINPKNPSRGVKDFVINENEKLDDLLVKVSKRMGLLKSSISYTLDIDATIIPSGVEEAQQTYKSSVGFAPMVCMIGNLPVYISMRSGNANPSYRKFDCLKKCLDILDKNGIKINRVRIDGAGYSRKILDYLHSRRIKFNIGARWADRTHDLLAKAKWTKKTVKTARHSWDAELCSFTFNMSNSDNTYRICAIRVPKEQRPKEIKDDEELEGKPTKWHLEGRYYYKFIITNDKLSSPNRIFEEYHQRGASERNFDYLKNDFGWRILPFSKLNENLVYMLLGALANNIYQAVLHIFAKKIKQLKLTLRLFNFKKTFISIPFSFRKGVYTFYNTNIDFQKMV